MVLKVDVEIRNLQSAVLRLSGVPEKIQTAADGVVKGPAYAIRDTAKTYDAAPVPGYARTGKMSRQTVARRAGALSWEAEMMAPYSTFVRGNQAWMHVGRWKTWAAIVSDKSRGLHGRLVAAIKAALQ